ncbi:MAG: hypothetical protein ACK5KT_17180 [Dysgonomonas sp.]
MKQLLYIFLIFISSSCTSTYYYSTLDTANEYVKKVDNGDFLAETDSLWIAYCFKGENAPIQITIFNKLDEPLFVDWEHSTLVIDSIPYPYTGAEAILYENDSLSTNLNYTQAIENGDMEMSENISTIPPNTMLSNIPLYLNPNLSKLDKELFKDGSMSDKYGQVKKINRADFEAQNSPFKFKSQLILYTQEGNAMQFEQDFFLTNQIKTKGIKPTNILDALTDRGDIFYSIKEANNNPLYNILGSTVLAGFIVLMAESGSTPSYE